MILRGVYNFSTDKDVRRLGAICVVAGGYGGDMPEDQADELLDDIDFFYNKVKCRKIEQLLPTLNKLVVEEHKSWMGMMWFFRFEKTERYITTKKQQYILIAIYEWKCWYIFLKVVC